MNKQLIFILLTIMLLLVGCGKTETSKEKVESAKTIEATKEKPAEKPAAPTTSEQKPVETTKAEEKPAVVPTEIAPADELAEEDIIVVEEKAEPEQISAILEESETDFGTVI